MIAEELYYRACAAIESAHSDDAASVIEDGKTFPAEVLYGRRMLSMLEMVQPVSSYMLKIAAQCQHLKRWGVPRADYPYDRRGYHQWRRVVMEYQLQQTAEILTKVGVEKQDILEINDALRNQGNKDHINGQTIMDTACLVFLKWHLEPFAAKHEQSKVSDILKKTMRKMSNHGVSLVKSLELPEKAREILEQVN
jgi:hypothetical protein